MYSCDSAVPVTGTEIQADAFNYRSDIRRSLALATYLRSDPTPSDMLDLRQNCLTWSHLSSYSEPDPLSFYNLLATQTSRHAIVCPFQSRCLDRAIRVPFRRRQCLLQTQVDTPRTWRSSARMAGEIEIAPRVKARHDSHPSIVFAAVVGGRGRGGGSHQAEAGCISS